MKLPEDIQRRLTVYRAVGCLLLIAVWGWFALVKNDQTPIFVYLNIAVHESGHVLFRPFGELTMLIMGSGFEVLFPLAAGVVFLLRKRDPVATVVCWGWAASALASAATYIADADDGRLALLGATGPDAAGDWERILGEEFFDKVHLADPIAGTVRTFGFVLWFVALGLAAWVIVRHRLEERAAAAIDRPGQMRSGARRSQPWMTSRCGGEGGRIRSLLELEYDAPASDLRSANGWKHRHDRMAEAGAAVLRVLES